MYKDNLSPPLFVRDNEALFCKAPDNRKALFQMTDGAETIIIGHSPPCCTTCAPVLGF